MRTVYIDGSFVPENEATVSIFDRSFLFSHGVYEVTSVINGGLIDHMGHMKRLKLSLEGALIPFEVDSDHILRIQKRLIEMNNLDEGLIYLQISRGAEDRDFLPTPSLQPSIVMFTQEKALLDPPQARDGIRIVSVPDIRWRRRDVKAVSLLAPVLAKETARQHGVQDAWMIEDGYVTEGTSNNAYIITRDNVIVTRHLSHDILHGITRQAVLSVAQSMNMTVEERPFTIEEAYSAREAFISSASTLVWPVVEIDGKSIMDGKVGAVTREIRRQYIKASLERLM
ncbi:D-amino-acid transaminase [Kordiimonas sp. SCSIO 12610]|uniref:D-amino-acid transaminase n=1 Tax=Kordiimonas sp. SCSIO 12610 TaxID=2829597 RepID=UPI002109B51F|nr:D-amino-acid transaminase [Kordiimonas sp. SCSIO 12610]UTW55851.1 D-amino-acid transaminase [Kordiimonas sp. SCSIO 12610]